MAARFILAVTAAFVALALPGLLLRLLRRRPA